MQQQFKPFAIGDRVISEADGPGTVIDLITEEHIYPVFVQMDSGYRGKYTESGHFFSWAIDSGFAIRHMTAEEQSKFPKP